MHSDQTFPGKPKITLSEIRGLVLVSMGVACLIFYWSWWFKSDRLLSPFLTVMFLFAVVYGIYQIFGNWLIYLATHRRFVRFNRRKFFNDFEVDVFITACGEEIRLVERAVVACIKMNGRFQVWLLDDGNDPQLARLANNYQIHYLTREGHQDKKAGNINHALQKTTGEIVVIFDIDHAPHPNFLERTVGYFSNPNIGFVQVMLTFENENAGWVASAAAESSLDFYNPTSIGTDGLWSATLIGSNALIRRKALASIGGYKPGLAEDLATSIALHAAKWQSIYVEEPLAPGLAPPDLGAWFTQQLKWSRGVFEIFLTDYFRLMPQLSRGKIAAYGVRMTYYWIGVVICLHIAVVLTLLISQSKTGLQTFQDYLLHLFPLAIMTTLIRQFAFRKWRHPMIKSTVQSRAILLVFSTWPIYTLSWLLAIFRFPLKFQPTPKTENNSLKMGWLLPQILVVIGLIAGTINLFVRTQFTYLFVLLFSLGLILPQVILLLHHLLNKQILLTTMTTKRSSIYLD